MAKAPTKKTADTKVTRITASDAGKAAAPGVQSGKPARGQKTAAQAAAAKKPTKNPFARLMRYFKGAWHELRQVRWPDRRATWGMTGALIVFTLFFVLVILLLDAGFNYLFKLIMGSN